MLTLLTDAHISPKVARQVSAKQPEIVIVCLQKWRDGVFLDSEDDVILTEAMTEGLTLVTYDQQTIISTVTQWAMDGKDHAGVIFIDEKAIRQKDVGGQVRALLRLWERANSVDWTNTIMYLNPD